METYDASTGRWVNRGFVIGDGNGVVARLAPDASYSTIAMAKLVNGARIRT